jgi:NAD(P)-dependent dehydrogenase (short-subunit alcohol dehydrogenase family)
MIKDKTIVITGAASGIGRAWAESFAKEGAKVIAADINTDGLDSLPKQNIQTIETDVADAQAVKEMIDFAVSETGRLDILFNNAGLSIQTRVEDLADDQFENHVAIHLFGTVSGMRFAIPHMRAQGYGRIINTISRAAEFGGPKYSAYAASKAGIWAATKSAANETKDVDILINMLIPGITNTGIWGKDRPDLQPATATIPTARMLATMPKGGAIAKVFWDEKEYPLFHPDNDRPPPPRDGQ